MSTLLKRIVLIVLPLLLVGYLIYQYTGGGQTVKGDIAILAYTFSGHKHEVSKVAFHPKADLVASGSVDSTVKLWKYDGTVVATLQCPSGVTSFQFSPDGRHLATAGYDAVVRIWALAEGKVIQEFTGHSGTVWTVAYSPDGSTLASAGEDALIRVWDIGSKQLKHVLKGHERIIWALKYSPDGSLLASGSFDKTVRIWQVASGRSVHILRQHTEAVVDLAFSHNNKLLATAGDDGVTRLWQVPGFRLLRTLSVPEHVQGTVFSADDKLLLTSGRDKTNIGELVQNFTGNSKLFKGISARLWHTETGKLLQTFEQHSNDVNDAAFSSDGRWLATGSADHTVQLWRIAH